MNNLVEIQNNQAVTSSRMVAEVFEREHRNVLKEIDKIIKDMGSAQKVATLFHETTYIHEQNKQEYRMYLMNRDGFTLLAMGFTGKKALEWKLKYIKAFNEMEKIIKNRQVIPNNLSPQLQVLINLELEQKKLKKEITETKQQIASVKENIIVDVKDWRKWANSRIRAIGARLGDYSTPYAESYEELERRARCNLDRRLQIKRENMLKAGAGKKKIDTANYLDVIEEDTRLKEIYTSIVKEMCVKYL